MERLDPTPQLPKGWTMLYQTNDGAIRWHYAEDEHQTTWRRRIDGNFVGDWELVRLGSPVWKD